MREDGNSGWHPDGIAGAQARLTLPAAVVVVVAHRGGDAPCYPVQRHHVEQEVPGETRLEVAAAVAPRTPLLKNPCGEPGWRVVQCVAESLGPGRLDRRVTPLGQVPALRLLQIPLLAFGQRARAGPGIGGELQVRQMQADERPGIGRASCRERV